MMVHVGKHGNHREERDRDRDKESSSSEDQHAVFMIEDLA